MTRRTHQDEISSAVASQLVGDGSPSHQVALAPLTALGTASEMPDDLPQALDHTLQILFSCCLTLCRASRESEHKDELLQSAIEGLDTSIRVLRGAAEALV